MVALKYTIDKILRVFMYVNITWRSIGLRVVLCLIACRIHVCSKTVLEIRINMYTCTYRFLILYKNISITIVAIYFLTIFIPVTIHMCN